VVALREVAGQAVTDQAEFPGRTGAVASVEVWLRARGDLDRVPFDRESQAKLLPHPQVLDREIP
jgi:hypothetical protein